MLGSSTKVEPSTSTEISLADDVSGAPDPRISTGYSGTPLPKKLGIRDGATVALLGAPADFERTLGPLPPAVRLRRDARAKAALTIWFVSTRAELVRGIARRSQLRPGEGLWIAWPKKSSGVPTDLTEDVLREVALPHGIVDIKVCAIDGVWAGLRFGTRATPKQRRGT